MSFFEKIFGKKQEKPEAGEKEKISLESLQGKIEELLKKSENQEQKIKETFKEIIRNFNENIKIKIKILEKIDLKEKREDEKLKQRVLDNLYRYIEYLSKFTEKILIIQDKKPEEMYKEANSLLNDFEKISKKCLEFSTILIGKEISETRKTIFSFYQEIEAIMKENSDYFQHKRILNSVLSKLSALNENKEIHLKIESNKKINENELKNLRTQLLENKKELEDLRNSEEYLNYLKSSKKNEDRKQEVIREISRIKENIDFKNLMTIYHTINKKKEIISFYKNDFLNALMESNELFEFKEIKETLLERLKTLKHELERLKEIKSGGITKKVKETENAISTLNLKIIDKENEIIIEKKKKEKSENEINLLKKEIKELSNQINLDAE